MLDDTEDWDYLEQVEDDLGWWTEEPSPELPSWCDEDADPWEDDTDD